MINKCDVVIIGAGAAGMMCAIEAGKRARKVVLLQASIAHINPAAPAPIITPSHLLII